VSEKEKGIFDPWPFKFTHEGELIGTVMEEDPKAVLWAVRKGAIQLDEHAMEYLRQCERDA
jgi:hypothetical protein